MADEVTKNRSNNVYEDMRAAIVSGKLRPNEPLIEDDLAKSYMVSRTPIRESFQRLFRDGLIVPRKRGWAVREFTRVEVQENYEVRAHLEGLAARLAATRGSPAQKAAIQRIHNDRLLLNTTSVTERVRSNRQLHDAIVAAAQNTRLADLIFATEISTSISVPQARQVPRALRKPSSSMKKSCGQFFAVTPMRPTLRCGTMSCVQ